MATAKDCYALTSYYEKLYQERYSTKPIVNKHRSRWGFDAILQGESLSHARELLDYYFTTVSANNHNLDWFFNNYDRLATTMSEHQEDAALREKIRRESAQRAAAWKERIGNQRVTGN
jgi:hypothetical protein